MSSKLNCLEDDEKKNRFKKKKIVNQEILKTLNCDFFLPIYLSFIFSTCKVYLTAKHNQLYLTQTVRLCGEC